VNPLVDLIWRFYVFIAATWLVVPLLFISLDNQRAVGDVPLSQPFP
jgi:hypothetical protein